MDLSPELWFAGGIAAVAFLVGIWALWVKAPRTRSVGRMAGRGPAELRYVCASCSGRFTHSRRTRMALEKGARSFYCKACHTRSMGVQPPKPSQLVPKPKGKPGCLGVLALLAVLPLGMATVLHYWV
jgi:DNA-directed RNA polymerase subunit RPC12/RpoP